MAQTIKLKRSGTSGNIPTTSQLELGEVAINTYDGKMFIKKNVGGTESIVEISAAAADAILVEYQFTSTASQTTYTGSDDNSETLSYTPNAIQVFMNGILLDPGIDFTATNGYSIVLAEAADANDYLQIFAFKKKISDGQVSVDTFTGDDSTVAFTLSVDPGDENNTRVFIDGVYQSKSNYSVSGTTLTFSTAPPTDTAVEVEIGNRVVTLDTLSDLDLPDSVRLRLGTGQDLQIYHDGSNSFISDSGPGNLIINGDDVNIANAADTEFKARFNSNGSVQLYYDNAEKFATTNDGITVTGDVEADEFIGDVRGAVLFKAQAGETLAKGEVVYISGISGNTTIVSKADADDVSKMPAFGLVAAAASSGNPVDIYTNGILSDIDTSSYSEGDELFVSTTAGALTATAPTGESAALQKIGKVTRSNATSGSIFIVGAGRSNAVPNLNEGRLFVGNSSNQAVADDTVHVDIANSRVGIGTSSPQTKLHVEGLLRITESSNTAFYGGDYVRVFGAGQEYGFRDTGGTTKANISMTGNSYFNGGNVGIGTASPSWDFVVSNAGAGGLEFGPDGIGAGTSFIQAYNRTSSTYDKLRYYASEHQFYIGGSNHALNINSNGNVGIGTSSPQTALHIYDTPAEILRMQGNDEYAYASFYGTVSASESRLGYMGFANDTSTAADFNFTNNQGGLFSFNSTIKVTGGLNVTSNITNNSAGHAYFVLNSGGVYESGIIYQRNSTSKWETYISSSNDDYKFYSYGDGDVQLEIRDGVDGNGGTILSGLGVSDGTGYYGSYGALLLDSNNSYTASARSWMVTNALKAYNFGILYSDSATTKPSLTTYGDAATGTSVALSIDNNGNVAIGTDAPYNSANYKTLNIRGTNGGQVLLGDSTNSYTSYYYTLGGGTVLGASSGNYLAFHANGAEKMRITDTGNVGIGTTPSYPFDLLTSTVGYIARFKSSGNYAGVSADAGTSGSAGGGYFDALKNGVRAGLLGVTGAYKGNAEENLGIFAETGKQIEFATNGSATEKVIIDTSGNLLIGTTTASAKLYAYKGSTGTITKFEGPAGRYVYSGTDSGGHYMEVVGTQASERVLRIQGNNGSGSYTQLFIDAGNQNIYTSTNCNVGIGTSAPSVNLQVKGGTNAFAAHFGQGQDNGSGSWGGISLGYNENNIYYRKVGIAAKATGDNAARQELHFLVDSANDQNSATLSDSKMMINTGGLVAIGQTTAAARLDIKAGGVGEVGLNISRSSSSGRAQFTLSDESGTNVWRVGMTGPASEDFAFFDGGANVVTLYRDTNGMAVSGDVAYHGGRHRLAAYHFQDTSNASGSTYYVHFKTTQATNTVQMTRWEFKGYNYGATKISECDWACHVDGSGNIYNKTYNSLNTSFQANNIYASSDGYVVIVASYTTRYYLSGVINVIDSPIYTTQGSSISAHTITTSNSGAY